MSSLVRLPLVLFLSLVSGRAVTAPGVHVESAPAASHPPAEPSGNGATGATPGCAPLYDTDPRHLWNRLYCILFVRRAADGSVWGFDSTDPLIWSGSRYLYEGDTHRSMLAVLDEFIAQHGERLVPSPLKRALLQRDLLSLFSVITRDDEDDSDRRRMKRALQARLARAIRSLALTPEEARSLPSNYSQAVQSRAYATEYNSTQPETPFVPPDLFNPGGPWVQLGEAFNPSTAAPQHLDEFNGRSTFTLFVRLPAGRQAALDYLTVLGRHGNNPNPPQFPPGTQFALVRRAVLVDSGGRLYQSPLVETFRTITFRRTDGSPRENQVFQDFSLSRAQLLAGNAGGLHSVGQAERGFPFLILQSKGIDGIELGSPHRSTSRLMGSCITCHSGGNGIGSVNSYHAMLARHANLAAEENPGQQEQASLNYLRSRYRWGVLGTLLGDPPR